MKLTHPPLAVDKDTSVEGEQLPPVPANQTHTFYNVAEQRARLEAQTD